MNTSKLYIASAVAAALALIGGIFAPAALIQGYHFAVLTCLQPSLGCLFLLLLFQTTGGRWGEKLLPALMVGRAMVIPCLLAVIPVLVFLPAVYHWNEVGDRGLFLNRGFFTVRWLIYLLVFGGLSLAIASGKRPAAVGLIGFALTGYFFAIDEIMAIDPEWYSSGFPVVSMASSALMAIALAAFTQAGDKSQPLVWRDVGGLLMAMVVFWSYVAFTQFLIIWMGNLDSEIGWYVKRGSGAWLWVSIFIAVFNLFVPFFLLLARAVKENTERLRRVSAMVFACQIVYLYCLIAHSLPGRKFSGIHWIDPLVLTAVLCLAAARFITLTRKSQS